MTPRSMLPLLCLALGLTGCPPKAAVATAPTASVAPAAPPEPTVPMSELVAARVSVDVSKPDPDAAYWATATPGMAMLIGQPMVTPRPEAVTTDKVFIQAVSDGKNVAFRLRWKDTEASSAGRLAEFSDAVALEFPMNPDVLPPVMMGGQGQPVHIFHWRAQYQHDAEVGKPTMSDLYPNASVDMYAMDFHEAAGGSKEEREMFNPGVALGNPQSAPKSGVDEIIAEGFSTSAVQAGHGSMGRGTWRDGYWTVVITRPLVIEGGSNLGTGTGSALAIAVWQGGKGEVGSRKSLMMTWIPLKVSG